MISPYYKCCPKLVPEDSVRPETRTLVILIRRKGCVGCFEILNLSNSSVACRRCGVGDKDKAKKDVREKI